MRRPPRATYRLQFHAGFGFDDARRVVPYLAALGISHVYASPVFKARPGSTHGYDVVDLTELNPELGGRGAFDAFVSELHRHRLGLVLDFVPNHMGIGPDNPWWVDVLAWGPASPFAAYFDIDWSPPERTLTGKVLLPVLGDPYGAVLERGELRLGFDRQTGTFHVDYHEHRFPIGPKSVPALLRSAAAFARDGDQIDGVAAVDDSDEAASHLGELAADLRAALAGRRSRRSEPQRRERVAQLQARLARLVDENAAVARALDGTLERFSGRAGEPRSFDALHQLLERQAYRLAYWRVAAHEINYRRFFDVNDLAALEMDVPELFDASHVLVARLIAEGAVDGLRLDHVDGLRDPKRYLERLQRLAAGAGAQRPFYVVVEKILARHETLRDDWATAGTTGYDFLADVNGLQVDRAAERALTAAYTRLAGGSPDMDALVVDAKHQIMHVSLASELNVLANGFHRLAQQNRRSRDYPRLAFRDALANVVAHFPVYRTYVTPRSTTREDRRDIDWALAQARRATRTPDTSIYDFVRDVLTLDLMREGRGYRRRDVVAAALKFQQYTGPVTAKAVEDTTFYRYLRLVSLNEVGGDPERFGTSVSAFHEANRRRVRSQPFGMLTLATHDHKRGADVRARLNVLSEVPRAWGQRVQRWMTWNRRKRTEVDGGPAPSRHDEYLFYQTVVGAWPFDADGVDLAEPDGFVTRVDDYLRKAVREAKVHSSWAAPNEAYERALSTFVTRCLDVASSRPFVDDVRAFVREIAAAGAVNGLAQTVLELTSPGVPDLYQGTEFWDFSLVDPDNRRPVDFERRRAGLEPGARPSLDELLETWRDGRLKQRSIERVLAVRGDAPELFTIGTYVPLTVVGAHADRLTAFARRHGERTLVVIAPRLVEPLLRGERRPLPRGWGDTRVAWPGDLPRAFEDVLSGRRCEADAEGGWRAEACLADLPVAVLLGM